MVGSFPERESDIEEDVSEVSSRTNVRGRNKQPDSDRKCENDTNNSKVDFLENKYESSEFNIIATLRTEHH